VDEFLETVERVAKGGSVVDPSLVQKLVAVRRRPCTAWGSPRCGAAHRHSIASFMPRFVGLARTREEDPDSEQRRKQ
jgi:hypothetical protein